MTIAKNIRRARNRAGLLQGDLAKRVGVRQTQISHYETGRSSPNPDMLGKIARVCNVSISFLYGETKGDGAKEQMAATTTLKELAKEIERLNQEEHETARQIKIVTEKLKKLLDAL